MDTFSPPLMVVGGLLASDFAVGPILGGCLKLERRLLRHLEFAVLFLVSP